MLEMTKAQRRKLRELAALAYERALARELTKLEAEFKRWREGEVNAFELEECIHRFHQGPARKLYGTYADSHKEWAVVGAIRLGLIQPEEVGADAMQILGPFLEFIEAQE